MPATKEQLLTTASDLGLEVSPSASKAEILAALKGAEAGVATASLEEAPRPSAAPCVESPNETDASAEVSSDADDAEELIYLPGAGSYTTRLAGKVKRILGIRAKGGEPFAPGQDRERLLATGRFGCWTADVARQETAWRRKQQGGTIKISDFPAGARKR